MFNSGCKNETTHISLSNASISENLPFCIVAQHLPTFSGNNRMKMKLP